MVSLKTFRRVALATTVLALVVVVMGAYVRLSHAGLSCPDWPGCYGQLRVPGAAAEVTAANAQYPHRPVDVERAWKEMTHRYLAGLLGLSILIMAVLAWRRRRMPGQQVGMPVILVGLVIFQALLGMWTVTLLLKPAVVVAHLLGGLVTLALCWWLFLRHGGREPAAAVSAGPRGAIWLALAVIFFQIGLGGWTSANYAALACPDFPLCQGRLWPQMSFAEGFQIWHGLGRNFEGGVLAGDARVAIHVVHRLGALVTFLYVGGLAVYFMRRRVSRGLSMAAGFLLLALFVQVALGIGNVVFQLPLAVAVAHNGVAALLLLSAVSVYHMALPPNSAL